VRTFQFSDAKSHKFWSVEVAGTELTVTYGKVGTAGQTLTKSFATPEKAQAEADKLIREKTGKGYVETTPKATTTDTEAFEKALLANPHDIACWSAYADYLMEQGDARGEFMQIQLALEDERRSKAERDALKKTEAALLKKHRADWLGPLKGEKDVTVAFARGWISRVEFKNLSVNQARALARTPDARLLRELVVESVAAEAPAGRQEQYIDSYYEPGPDVPADIDSYDGPGLHALCRCPHLGSVRVFQLGESVARDDGTEEEYYNCHMSGELAYHLVKQMPNLEELYLFAHRVDANKIFPLPLPNLRVLQLYHSNSYPLDKLAANKSLTNLTTLLCHPHAMEFDDEEPGAYIRLPHLRAICRSPHLKALTHLRQRLTDFGDRGVKEIVESGILKRLRVLDLKGGCITDEGAKLLAGCPDLKHLESLDLRSNALTADGQQAIQATGVRADTSAQHGQGPESFADGNIPEYLYEGDIE
jgi:uncharacterized protein (TIGR02996 family)